MTMRSWNSRAYSAKSTLCIMHDAAKKQQLKTKTPHLLNSSNVTANSHLSSSVSKFMKGLNIVRGFLTMYWEPPDILGVLCDVHCSIQHKDSQLRHF